MSLPRVLVQGEQLRVVAAGHLTVAAEAFRALGGTDPAFVEQIFFVGQAAAGPHGDFFYF